MAAPRATLGALCVTVVSLCLAPAAADVDSGCPSWGCVPSGTFALSSDLPGRGNANVGVKWKAAVSRQGGGRRLGCVSCQDAVICATSSGYVDVDEGSGKVAWRYDNMTDPSLPILDIYGDIIGTDGRHLIKINDDGTVQKPIIKFYDKQWPMYSIQLANDNLMLMVSQEGLLITYATNGIPEASLMIRDELERVNGTFLPVAQPVIYGKRAYILMQFAPDVPLPQDKQGLTLGLQRLYAIDLWARMAKRIDPVWYFNFERLSCPSDVTRPGTSPDDDVESDSSVLVHNNTVYVSLGRPLMGCSRPGQPAEGMLWALEDQGDVANVLFKTPAAVPSNLALYDVTIGQKESSWAPDVMRYHDRPHKNGASRAPGAQAAVPVLWVATSQQIYGYDSRNGSVKHVVNVSKLLNAACRVTSKVMVTRKETAPFSERLLFAAACTSQHAPSHDFNHQPEKHLSTFQEMNSHLPVSALQLNYTNPFMVAMNVISGSDPILLWKVAGEPGTEIVGQITNGFVPAAGGRQVDHKGNMALKFDGGSDGTAQDDIDVVLVGTAVSKTEQHIFAIGMP